MNWFQKVIKSIEFQREYYALPTIDKLSDYDKGVHAGRSEGLGISLALLGFGIEKQVKKIRANKE